MDTHGITWILRSHSSYRKTLKLHFSLLFTSIKYYIGIRLPVYLLQIDNYDKQLSGINYCEDKLNRWKMYLLHYIKDLMSFVWRNIMIK